MLQNLLRMNEMEGNSNFQQQAQNSGAQASFNAQMMADQQQSHLGKPSATLLNQMFNGNFNKMAGLQNIQAKLAAPENGLFQASSASLENMGRGMGSMGNMGNMGNNRMGSGLQLSQMQNQQFGSSSFLPGSQQVPQSALSQSNFNWSLSNSSLAAANAVQSGSFGNLGSFNSMSMMGRGQLDGSAIPQGNAQWGPMPSAPPMSAPQALPPAAEPEEKADPYSQNGLLGPWSAASAELLGDLMLSQGQGKKPRKKQKDKPKRPLSAYNIFFKEERQRILEDIPDKELADIKKPAKRKGKKTPHGKIDFQSLAKVIGKRWQELSESELDIYKSKSEADKLRYKKEMEVYIVSSDDKEE